MIDRVHFENFKSLADVTIDLGRFTVLVGPNGCGKSSVLEAMRIHAHAGLNNDLPHRLARDLTLPIILAGRALGSEPDELLVRLEFLPSGPKFSATLRGALGDMIIVLPDDELDDVLAFEAHPRMKAFASCVYLRPSAARMAETTIPLDEVPHIANDGHGLASTLAWMKGAAEDELAEVTRAVAGVVPGVTRIRTFREKVVVRDTERIDIDGQPLWRPVEKTLLGDRFALEFNDGRTIPSDLLSEGTVLALGLLTKLHAPSRPRVVLLDDIDRGLHLSAQAELVARLRALLDAQPDLQIVCTTHSPYLLDLFKPEEVRVMALDGERRTRVRALSDHPDIEKWKIGTQTGELWATLGESWVLEAGGG